MVIKHIAPDINTASAFSWHVVWEFVWPLWKILIPSRVNWASPLNKMYSCRLQFLWNHSQNWIDHYQYAALIQDEKVSNHSVSISPNGFVWWYLPLICNAPWIFFDNVMDVFFRLNIDILLPCRDTPCTWKRSCLLNVGQYSLEDIFIWNSAVWKSPMVFVTALLALPLHYSYKKIISEYSLCVRVHGIVWNNNTLLTTKQHSPY